jgi:hypothetical protein
MKETKEIIEVIKDYLELTVPPALLAVTPTPPTPIDKFLGEIVSNPDQNQIAVYMGDGNFGDAAGIENIMITVQLPTVATPLEHHNVVWKILKAFDPSTAGATTKSGEYLGWYPGEPGGGGGGSVVHYAISLSEELTDCDNDY